jgi:hypothetical protein
VKGALVMQGSEIQTNDPLSNVSLLNFELFMDEGCGVRKPILEINGDIQAEVSFRKGRPGAIDDSVRIARIRAAELGHEVTRVIVEIP